MSPPNILLVVLDSVRARNTSLHGYYRETTPFLSDFADDATVYSQARSPGIHSIASHVSLFTGMHVEEHRATNHTARIDPTRTIWHELRSRHGYTTGLFTNNRIVSNASNLAECFERTVEPTYPLSERLENTLGHPLVERTYFRLSDGISRLTRRMPTLGTGPTRPVNALGSRLGRATSRLSEVIPTGESGYETVSGIRYTDAFLDWERNQHRPWAACINVMDAHAPYEPLPTHDRWADDRHWYLQDNETPSVRQLLLGDGWDQLEAFESLYDGTIRQADAVVESLVNGLDRRDLLDETLLIVTSDHGEAFGETSEVDPGIRIAGHRWGIHEALTHVPLIVREPTQDEGQTVTDVVSLTDLPRAIRSIVSDETPVCDSLGREEPVLASTFRLPPRHREKFRTVEDIDRYVGPWRAVYESKDNEITKFAQKGERFVALTLERTSTAVQSREPHARVTEAYEPLADENVLTDDRSDIQDDLETKLEALGYIR